MTLARFAALAALALSITACGSDNDRDQATDAAESAGQQKALPKCEEIVAPGQIVDAAAVAQPEENSFGVCTYTDEDGEESSLMFMWAFKCEDGGTFVYSKEFTAMGFDGEAWQEATEDEIDATQAEEGCWGEAFAETTEEPSTEPTDGSTDEETPAASGGSATESACQIYATMTFDDAQDERAAKDAWALHDSLDGDLLALVDAHHRSWVNNDYEAAYSLPSLWPAMQKQCAQAGVNVQDAGWDY